MDLSGSVASAFDVVDELFHLRLRFGNTLALALRSARRRVTEDMIAGQNSATPLEKCFTRRGEDIGEDICVQSMPRVSDKRACRRR